MYSTWRTCRGNNTGWGQHSGYKRLKHQIYTYKPCTISQECKMYSTRRTCWGKGHRFEATSYIYNPLIRQIYYTTNIWKMHNFTGVYTVQFVEDLPGKGTPVGGNFLYTINWYAKFTTQLTCKKETILQECTMHNSWRICRGKEHRLEPNFYVQ